MGLSVIISSIIGMNFFYVLIDGSFSINFHYNQFFIIYLKNGKLQLTHMWFNQNLSCPLVI